jgi:hypothetical protein
MWGVDLSYLDLEDDKFDSLMKDPDFKLWIDDMELKSLDEKSKEVLITVWKNYSGIISGYLGRKKWSNE